MLRELQIHNLGVIDEATLELSPGLTVLTGETGAGKTMVVTALDLLLGGRGDSGLVRTDTPGLRVEGYVELAHDHRVRAEIEDLGGHLDEELVLARSVSAAGRSKATAGGVGVPIATLGELSQHLVAVHGQADQWRLKRPEEHRAVLDAWAGAPLAHLAQQVAQTHADWERARKELDELTLAARDRAQEIDMLRHQLDQIAALDPQPGEDTQLAMEGQRLGHAEALQRASAVAASALTGQEDGEGASVIDLLGSARNELQPVLDADPQLAELATRLTEVSVLASELATDFSSYSSGIEVDPARLAHVQERRSELTKLMRSYGDTVDEVLAHAARASERLALLDHADEHIDQLRERCSELTEQLREQAEALTAARIEAAQALGEQITEELSHLAMGAATVSIAVTQNTRAEAPSGAWLARADGSIARVGRHGFDDVDLQLAANPGSPARSVVKAASGGELSRVMLAIEVVTGAQAASVPTFVFDEVDAGVGGAAALDVGARLAALAAHAQVIVVTHLAQVAAYADTHLVVRKSHDGHVTSSDVVALDAEQRQAELARMMGGADTAAGMQHAAELLKKSAQRRGTF